MNFDPLATLRAAGYPMELVDEARLAVFAELAEFEIAVLVDVKQRLDAARPEVEGQGQGPGDLKVL